MKFKASLTPKGGVIFNKLKTAENAGNDALYQALARSTLEVHAAAVKGIMQKSSGETQTRYNPKRTVVASKPGDPPNVDFGVFVKSVQFDVDPSSLTGAVGTNDKRGPWFEFGTKDMKPRPWLGVAYKSALPAIRSYLKNLRMKYK